MMPPTIPPTTSAQISSLGRFRTKFGKIVTPTPNPHGGDCYVKHQDMTIAVHRLVAFCFLGRPDEDRGAQGGEQGGRAVNLRWATPRENMAVIRKNALSSFKPGGGFKRSKPVKARAVGETEWSMRFESTNAAAQKLDIDRSNISACCNMKVGYKSARGYEFAFDEPNEPEQLPGEEWRRHEGTGHLVSSLGRVKFSTTGFVSRGHLRSDGYVVLQTKGSDGRARNRLVHRLVAEAFELPRLPDQVEVDHVDGDRSNNSPYNLEWVTPGKKIRQYLSGGAKPFARGGTGAEQRSHAVEALSADGKVVVARFPSSRAAAEALGVRSASSISDCLSGRQKSCGGFQFRRVMEGEAGDDGEVWMDIPDDIVSILG